VGSEDSTHPTKTLLGLTSVMAGQSINVKQILQAQPLWTGRASFA